MAEENFAVLDDSSVWKNGVYVYAHALIRSDENYAIKIFDGKENIKKHESEIIEFIRDNTDKTFQLYGCTHYRNSKKIWKGLKMQSVECNDPESVKHAFIEAHQLAKQHAKQRLEELLEQYSK
jgi:2,3-bisphosphoglycerate-independent phosphoglycerate mutase